MVYSIEADKEFLRVKLSGRESDRPPSDVCAIVLRESEKLQRKRILIELDQQFPLSSTSQHLLVTRLPEIGFTHEHRIALVHKAPEAQQANEFINVVAGNRGIGVRNFPTLEKAMAWLREPAPG
jgi:hypothetical protein